VQIQKENFNENKVLKYCLFFIQTFFLENIIWMRKKIRTTSRIYRNFWILKLLNNRYTQKLAKSYGIFIKRFGAFQREMCWQKGGYTQKNIGKKTLKPYFLLSFIISGKIFSKNVWIQTYSSG
jgi:hypothetical protein